MILSLKSRLHDWLPVPSVLYPPNAWGNRVVFFQSSWHSYFTSASQLVLPPNQSWAQGVISPCCFLGFLEKVTPAWFDGVTVGPSDSSLPSKDGGSSETPHPQLPFPVSTPDCLCVVLESVLRRFDPSLCLLPSLSKDNFLLILK